MKDNLIELYENAVELMEMKEGGANMCSRFCRAGEERLDGTAGRRTPPAGVAAEEPSVRVIFFTCNYMYSSMDYMKDTLVYM